MTIRSRVRLVAQQMILRPTLLAAFIAVSLVVGGSRCEAAVFPDSPGPVADAVFGQPNFTSKTPGRALNQMSGPISVVFDSSGVMYVADNFNDRILVFTDLNDTTADRVIGGTQTTSTLPGIPSGVGIDRLNNPAFWRFGKCLKPQCFLFRTRLTIVFWRSSCDDQVSPF
jgi:hypothetical protein